jgi:hypothetical protein
LSAAPEPRPLLEEVAVHDLEVVCRVAVGTVSDETAGPQPPGVASSVSMLGWITRGGGKRDCWYLLLPMRCVVLLKPLWTRTAHVMALWCISIPQNTTEPCPHCPDGHAPLPLTRLTQKPRGNSPTRMGCRKGILRLNCEQKRKPSSLVIRQQ